MPRKATGAPSRARPIAQIADALPRVMHEVVDQHFLARRGERVVALQDQVDVELAGDQDPLDAGSSSPAVDGEVARPRG